VADSADCSGNMALARAVLEVRRSGNSGTAVTHGQGAVMDLILVILVLLLLFGGGGGYYYGGPAVGGGLGGLFLIILVLWLLFGSRRTI
jgi:hypothetical protein